MKVRYLDGVGSLQTEELDLLVRDMLRDTVGMGGQIENLEQVLDNVTAYIGKLTSILVEKRVLDDKDLNELVNSHSYSHLIQMMNTLQIQYLKGDATEPIGSPGKGVRIICHICNDIGKWGAGFTGALSKKWKRVEKEYRDEMINGDLSLGETQFVQVRKDLWVANMIAQKGVRSKENPTPIKYPSLQEALMKVAEFAVQMKASVHGPRFGAGLAGGNWTRVEHIINETLIASGVPVYIYDLEE